MKSYLDRAVSRVSLASKGRIGYLTSAFRTLPDYIVIGAQKSGSTTLFNYIIQHPDCGGSFTKEVHYFDYRYHRGERWYRAHFPVRGRFSSVGEASPYYLTHPHVADRIRNDVPGVALLAILRDPVERAVSHYFHELRAGRESLGFTEALAAEDSRTHGEYARMVSEPNYYSRAHQSFTYKARGNYVEQLLNYAPELESGSLKVIFMEELSAEPVRTMRDVWSHLNVRADRVKLIPKVSNSGANRRPVDPSALEALRAHFSEPNRRLAELLGRKLPWDS